MQDPVLADVKLIAEPWDCGPGGYQVGGFPPGWAEWNDKFRDTVRDFWRGEATAAALAPRLCALARRLQPSRPPALGERQLHHRARRLHAERPRQLQRQAQRGERRGQPRRPLAQPLVELRRRGPDRRSRRSAALRKRQMRNMLATLLLSQGTPMLLAGDEFGRTQQGNNNAYCQDNEISLGRLEPRRRATQRADRASCSKLTGLRHKYPILRRKRLLTGEYNEELGVKDVTWINATGEEMRRGAVGRRQRALLRHAARRPRAGDRHPPAAAQTRRCSSSSTRGRTW